jgi:hypothetical protein
MPERSIERTLWDILVARLDEHHRLIVVSEDGLDVEDASDLRSGLEAARQHLQAGAERVFVGRLHEKRPVLLEMVSGQLYDAKPDRKRRSRVSPLGAA